MEERIIKELKDEDLGEVTGGVTSIKNSVEATKSALGQGAFQSTVGVAATKSTLGQTAIKSSTVMGTKLTWGQRAITSVKSFLGLDSAVGVGSIQSIKNSNGSIKELGGDDDENFVR